MSSLGLEIRNLDSPPLQWMLADLRRNSKSCGLFSGHSVLDDTDLSYCGDAILSITSSSSSSPAVVVLIIVVCT